MKKLATLLIALVFFGCSKNSGDKPDDPPVVIEHKIVGKWQYAAFMDDVGPFEWEPIENGDIMEFKANGDYEIYYGDPNADDTCSSQKTYVIFENPDGSSVVYYCDEEMIGQANFYITEHDELIFTGPFQMDKWVRVAE